MRRLILLACAVPGLLAAASASVVAPRATTEQMLALAEAETRAAEVRVRRLEERARKATDEAAKLAAERQAAAADIALAEARIAGADAALAQIRAGVALRERRLARQRAPLAALLAGLATIGQRPPILALADGATVTEVVRVRALIDATMPLIARRSAALQAELGEGRRLAERSQAAARSLAERRVELVGTVERFAALERRALDRAALLRRNSFGEQDRVMAGSETLLDLRSGADAARTARATARAIAASPVALPRPFAAEGEPQRPPLAYALPTSAPVVEGLGAVSSAGVRSRGIRFATPRGSAIGAPAAGNVLFAGAYREHDGIVIVDHGGGWTSLLIAVAPAVERGDRVALGEPLGRALGDVSLELRHRGQPRSAALIAGSSDLLSNRAKTR